jgi:glycosyltransferase involved in cell wall biosynthesis
MVTRDRYPFARLAIEAFRRQTHAERELVVVQDGADTRLVEEIEQAGDATIRAFRAPAVGLSLGALRNFAVAAARGPFVCQWDDDDLYDPDRITAQMAALQAAKADACFLGRWLMWMPSSRRLGIPSSRLLEGSMLAVKAALAPYPDLTHSEDTTVAYQMRRSSRIALINMPRLYVYAFHGQNTWAADHFEQQWQSCDTRYTGARYRLALEELERRLPIAAYEHLLMRSGEVTAEPIGGSQAPRVAKPSLRPSASLRVGFNIYGDMAAPTGAGTAARGTVAALAAARLPYAVVDLDQLGVKPASGTNEPPPERPHLINVFHTTPDRVERLVTGLQPLTQMMATQRRYNIAYFSWESVSTFPQAWGEAFQHFDEIWVPSRFVADSLRPRTSLPIVEIPHVLQRHPVLLSRSDLALPKDRFVFLFIFDELSNFTRKNPLGAIGAFKRAFSAGDNRAALVIRARTLSAQNRARLTAAAAGFPIRIFVEENRRIGLSSLLAHAGAFLSLHRAEGFGLALAEAMQLKLPVVATAYSGNLDFMTLENSYLVPYHMVRLEDEDGIYPAGTEWADPDLDAAAGVMRDIVADPSSARRRAERAAADVEAWFSPLAVAERIVERLAVLSESGRLDRVKMRGNAI